MRATNSLARCCWAALALAATGLQAQDAGVSSALKFRGLLSSTAKDQGMTNGVFGQGMELGFGFGLEVGYHLGAGKITGELGYSIQNGDAIQGDLTRMAKKDSTVTINGVTSFDTHKNKLDGVLLRLGYEAPFSDQLSWRAGLQVGGTKFTNQVTGNTYGTTGVAHTAYSDNYISVTQHTSLTPSLYGGTTYAFDANSALELGLVLLQYTALDYHHVANTNNGQDTISEKKRIVPTFEFAYVFRF